MTLISLIFTIFADICHQVLDLYSQKRAASLTNSQSSNALAAAGTPSTNNSTSIPKNTAPPPKTGKIPSSLILGYISEGNSSKSSIIFFQCHSLWLQTQMKDYLLHHLIM